MKNIKQPAQTDSKQMSVGRFKELLYLQEWMVSFQRAQRTRPSEKLSTLFLTSHQSAGKKKSARFQTPVRCDSWLAGEMYMPRWKWGRKRVRIQFGNNCSCAAFWYPKCQRRRTRHRARNGRSRVCVHLTLCFWSGNRLRLFELGCGCGFIPET